MNKFKYEYSRLGVIKKENGKGFLKEYYFRILFIFLLFIKGD